MRIPTLKKINVMGMDLDEWKWRSCTAQFGVGDDWATLYHIKSKEEGKGHATELLVRARVYYERKGLRFGGSVALSPAMSRIYRKLKIKEYKDENL